MKITDRYIQLYLNTRFLGRTEDQEAVKQIGKKIIRELNSHIRTLEEGKSSIQKLVSKPSKEELVPQLD